MRLMHEAIRKDKALFFYYASGFKPYAYQIRWMLSKARRKIANKARQAGFSKVLAAELLFNAWTASSQEQIYISRSKRTAHHTRQYVRAMIRRLGIQSDVERDTEELMVLRNGCCVYFLPAASACSLGLAGDIVIDEGSQYGVLGSEIKRVVFPMTIRGHSMAMVSPPFGHDELWWPAWEGGLWERHTIHWSECPDLCGKNPDTGMLLMEEKRIELGEDIFGQEFCNQILDESVAFITQSLWSANVQPEKIRDIAEGKGYLNLIINGGNEAISSLLGKCMGAFAEIMALRPDRCGWDIARKNDASEFMFGRMLPEGLLVILGNITLHDVSMSVQETLGKAIAQAMRMNVDKGMFGMSVADHLNETAGSQARCYNLVDEFKAKLSEGFKAKLEQRDKIALPHDPPATYSLRDQSLSIRRTQGAGSKWFKYDSERKRGEHADKYWALALCAYEEPGKQSEIVEIDYS